MHMGELQYDAHINEAQRNDQSRQFFIIFTQRNNQLLRN